MDLSNLVTNLNPKRNQKPKPSPKSTSVSTAVLISAVVAISSVLGYVVLDNYMRTSVNTPFDVTNPLNLSYHSSKWGTLRSNVYFGTKTMSPESLVTGLMWFRNQVESNSIPIRHWCNQHDQLGTYGWRRHDFDRFGVQTITDRDLKITTKIMFNDDDTWDAKILFEPLEAKSVSGLPISLVYYVATESQTDKINIAEQSKQSDNEFYVTGSTPAFEDFQLTIGVEESFKQHVLYRGSLSSKSEPPLVQLKETFMKNLFVMNHGRNKLFVVQNGEDSEPESNFIAHQIIFTNTLQVSIKFSKGSEHPEKQDESSKLFDKKLDRLVDQFDTLFENTFNLFRKGFKTRQVEFAKMATSNMIGSVGYFFGKSKVQSKWTPEPVEYGPMQLLTAVPSRSFFPRGFLWDEGFHNLLITRIKPDLSLQIMRSWLGLMNSEGWIPREVILGQEAEARVPQEFVVQKNMNANPPTLFVTLELQLKLGLWSKDELVLVFPRLQAWYSWFNNSQTGPLPGTYRWRGRDREAIRELNPKTLTSGLDDYPRATHPTEDEYHVDLRCWMALASRVMSRIAAAVGDSGADQYSATAAYLSDNELLDRLHWCEESKGYCDFGLHSTNVQLVRAPRPPGAPANFQTDMIRRVVKEPKLGFVHEFGYVSLFPLFNRMIQPTNPKLPLLLETLRNPHRLWTDYGLRSLSLDSGYYQTRNTEHDPPYWRGAIWIQMNYLALQALHYYGSTSGPAQALSMKIYHELRNNVINNVYKQYETSGYIWEQYDDKTGQGKGSHPFTGWSSLVVLIMAEEY
ncbi:Mannosyl-oligosaccharide glucosidase [Halotydeus destructor]|nr:Mannosyl-oligosaccharide glucosidase [Halotydeus destructor]